MKKLLVAGTIAMFGLVSAQKGSVLVGGDISYDTTTTTVVNTDTKTQNFSFNPTVGYQFADHWTAGVRFGIGSSKTTAAGVTTANTDNYKYGAFVRYTMPLSDIFAVYGDLDAYGLNSKNNITDVKTNGFGIVFTPNLFINFKNSFGLNFNVGGLGYQHTKVSGFDNKTNSFGFSFGQGVTVGISKNFK